MILDGSMKKMMEEGKNLASSIEIDRKDISDPDGIQQNLELAPQTNVQV
jgi:hypothetical protein